MKALEVKREPTEHWWERLGKAKMGFIGRLARLT